jgi:hypothetical protein
MVLVGSTDTMPKPLVKHSAPIATTPFRGS